MTALSDQHEVSPDPAIDSTTLSIQDSAGGRPSNALGRFVDAVGGRLSSPSVWKHFWVLPSLPLSWRKSFAPRIGHWSNSDFAPPANLLTVRGIRRDRRAEDEAFASAPLHDWIAVHNEAVRWLYKHGWRIFLPMAPRLVRATRRAKRAARQVPAPAVRTDSAEALTAALKGRAAGLGISALGVAEYDPRYTFATRHEKQVGDTVVVCVLEQNYAATQTIPSARAEKAALAAYAVLLSMTAELAEFLQQRGYQAVPHDVQGDNIVHHYAVEAGLGQMGLNGQLLTPEAGSRCRIMTISTNAPLIRDIPQDFGIHAICDACKICVDRCPSGAIPAKRKYYRGVEKAKLNVARCFPVVAQAHGCAICMKVCPVQRYGLRAVSDEYQRSGRIPGKHTDELEGYELQGRYYGPGNRPRLRSSWFTPRGLVFDPRRAEVPPEVTRDFG